MFKKITGIIFFALAGLLAVPAPAQDAVHKKIHPWVWKHTENGAQAEFFIVMSEQADLAYADTLATKNEKGKFVYATLVQAAERSQASIRHWLKSRKIEFQAFFIVNALLVKGDRNLVLELEARNDVDRLVGNPVVKNVLPGSDFSPEPACPPKPGATAGGLAPQFCPVTTPNAPTAPAAVEWNITKTNAPGVWGLGFFGQGIVVGAQDTGYRWTHSFVKGKYRGWNGVTADHNYNWHDSIHPPGGSAGCPANSPVPCDDNGHGTHTIGTVLGDDGLGNQVGMAPQAKWIGCRNMDLGNGTPSTYLECFQFFLAPTRLDGTGADPTKAPDVTTNSWSCPPVEGCTVWDIMKTAVDNQKAAGIMTVVAAQNAGPACGTVADPPGIYGSAYSVGATDSGDVLAGFSSRGPAAGSNLMKPEISAPGVNVRSGWNTNDTATNTISGTSMATPNVAGGVALLWSARPCYKNKPDLTAALFNTTARRLNLTNPAEACGGDYVNGPNNSWGYGLLNVLAAVNGSSCCAAPTGMANNTATDVSACAASGINVAWTAPTVWNDGATGTRSFTVLRNGVAVAAGPCSGVLAETTLSCVDTSVVVGTPYTYTVTATSRCSGAVTTTPGATATDANNSAGAPTAVAASSNSCANVTVTWTNGTGATSHNVLRYTGACPSAAGLVTNTGVVSPFTDATAAAGSSYCYVAQSQNACGTTNAAGVTGTRLATPGAPAAPAATGTCAGVNLTFAAPPVSTTYTILRSTVCGGAATTVASGVAGTTYSDATAAVGTTYFYTLQAINTCGSSVVSACSAGAARLAPPSPTVTGASSGCGSIPLSTQVYTAYQWNLGGVPIAGATAQNYSALSTGTYSVTATGGNGCAASSPGLAVTVTPGSQTFHVQVESTFVAGYKDMTNANSFEAALQQQPTANITTAGEYQIGSTPLRWLSPAYAKNTDLASSPWTFDVYGLTTNTGAAGLLYAKVYRYNAGAPVLLFTTGYAATDISSASTQTRFTWNYTPAAGTMLATGDRLVAEIWVHATAGSPGASTTTTASAEADPGGSVITGTFIDTQVCDAARQTLSDNGQNNAIDHNWTFAVPAGAPAPVFQFVGSYAGGATAPPAMQWSTSAAGPWTAMFIVTNIAEPACGAPQTFTLPAGQSGNVFIRAFKAAGSEVLSINYMAIVKGSAAPFFSLNYDFASADTLITTADCQPSMPPPPETSGTVPTALKASKGATVDTVVLNFEDVTVAAVTGYNAYEGNMPFAAATPYSHGSAPGNVCNVATTLAAGRRTTPAAGIGTVGSHYYLVTAFNTTLEGPSGNNSALVEIPPAMSTCPP